MFGFRDRINRHIEKLEKRVEQLECPHEYLQFSDDMFRRPVSICVKCRKVTQRFDTKREWLEAELEYERKRCSKGHERCALSIAEVEKRIDVLVNMNRIESGHKMDS